MLNLGQKLQTVDVAKALHNENGIFEATSPQGEILRVECRQGYSVSSITSHDNGNWQVHKIAELPARSEEQEPRGRARAAGAGSNQ